MDLLKELIRDLIGIIFPGSILVFLIIAGTWALSFFLYPEISVERVSEHLQIPILFFFFIAVSYIAGQYLRIKTLTDIENKASLMYRKERQQKFKENKEEGNLDFEKYKNRLKTLSKPYFEKEGQLKGFKEVIREIQHGNRYFRKWERFPYPYEMLRRRLLFKPYHYNKFFQKFVEKGNMKVEHDHYFINFCKVVVSKFNPDLKDEILRQQSLVRLLAGIYYVTKFGQYLGIILGLLYLVFGVVGYTFFDETQLGSYKILLTKAPMIFLLSLITVISCYLLKREIIQKDKLRTMRQAEVELVFDSFYTVCTTEKDLKNLDLLDFTKET